MFSFQLKKGLLWLAWLLPLLFVSDILYGAMDLYGVSPPVTPGVMLRGLVLLISIYIIITHRSLVGRGLLAYILLLVVVASPGLFTGLFLGQSFFFDLSAVSKMLYLPLLTALFVVLMCRYGLQGEDLLRFIEYSGYTLGIALLISQGLGLQRVTYGDYAFGSTGIFYAQNDLTLAFGLALLAGGFALVMRPFSLVRVTMLALSAFACVQIGTRASLAVIAGTALTAMICAFWGHRVDANGYREGARWTKWLLGLVLLGLLGVMLGYGLSKQGEYQFQQQKLEQIAAGEFPRLSLVAAGIQRIAERPSGYNVFGEGADSFQRGVAQYFPTDEARRMVEVDWVDITGSHGLIFTVLLYFFVFFVLVKAGFSFLHRRLALAGLIAAAALLYLGHSIFAGHALVSPIPGTLMAAYFAIWFRHRSPGLFGRVSAEGVA